MTTTTKVLLVIGAVLVGWAIWGAYQYPKYSEQQQEQVAGSSTAGSTFNTAKVAEITINPISLTSTSTSILNGDANDRIVDSGFVSCATSSGSVVGINGAGVASWTWKFATTTASALTGVLGLQGNPNNIMNMTVATSATDNEYTASSTAPALVQNRLWPSGTYLSINANASSSNATLTCQAGVYYHGT